MTPSSPPSDPGQSHPHHCRRQPHNYPYQQYCQFYQLYQHQIFHSYGNLYRDPYCYSSFIHDDFDHNNDNCSGYCTLKAYSVYQLANLGVCENPYYYEFFIDNTSNFNNSQSSLTSATSTIAPKDSISTGAIVGTVIGSLFVLAASIGIFMLVHRRRYQTAMASLGRVSPLLIDAVHEGGTNVIPNGTPSQEKERYIQHNHINSRSQTEPESGIRPSALDPLLLHSLTLVRPGEMCILIIGE
ncbi:hypothetical protein BDP27DRAFT_1360355 [Rhodocollybia butyracea]|uniref:Uncharacterized protein n=1 Tax=Rhodocollybia butyracea TaxID=206335 RepID=A0A9P5UCR4_9AGAR|nr:hypothetical protein BDP27DRAFT_1360355 [Rhodocollybia butyracea]